MNYIKCNKCGTLYSVSSSRCPKCMAVGINSDDETTRALPNTSCPPPIPPTMGSDNMYGQSRPQPHLQGRPMYGNTTHSQQSRNSNSSSSLFKIIIIVLSIVVLVMIGVILGIILKNDSENGNGTNAVAEVTEAVASNSSLENPKWTSDVSDSDKAAIQELLNDMVKVDGGTFYMGVNAVYKTVDTYYIGKYEVTQRQWNAVMGTTINQQRAKYNGNRTTGVGDRYPMYYVNQSEAAEFCRVLSAKTGLNFKLPTEEQWEYAAKAGGKENYTYSGSNQVSNVAWCNQDYNNGMTLQVGSLMANGLGIYDMSGNVWEWCRETAMLRGGCFMHTSDKCKVTWHWQEPKYTKGYNRGGFRIVME